MTVIQVLVMNLALTYMVRGVASQPPILIDLKISGNSITFELDTGATVTLMSEEVFKRLLPDHRLDKSKIKLRTYTGEL